VDKIVKSIEGEVVNVTDNVEAPDSILENAPSTSEVAAQAAKLPSAPTLNTLTPSSVISINFEVPKLGGGSFTVSESVDFSAYPYATPIAVFRGALLVVLTLIYFMLTFAAVRSAFAGK